MEGKRGEGVGGEEGVLVEGVERNSVDGQRTFHHALVYFLEREGRGWGWKDDGEDEKRRVGWEDGGRGKMMVKMRRGR